MAETRRFSTFSVAGLFFGVEVERVQEVLRYQAITPVPLAPPVVGGLINLRGQIVTALDLRRRLGLPDRGPGENAMNLVLRTDDGAVSLLVDEIKDVVEVSTDSYEPSPNTVKGQMREVIAGVYKLKYSLLLALNTAVVLQTGTAN